MAGVTKTLTFAEGVTTSGPTTTFLQATQFATYADDATFVSNKGSAAADGDAYYNTTTDTVRIYADGSWQNLYDDSDTNVALLSGTQTFSGDKTFSSAVNISDTTQSTDKDTGALIVEGGVGIEKNLYVGGNADITGNLNVQGTTTTVDDLVVTDETITVNNGGNQAAADTNDAGLIVSMSDATNATVHYDSTATSKWKMGEVGSTVEIADISSSQTLSNKTFSSAVNISDTTQSTDKDTGSLITEGGVGIEKNLYVGGNADITGTLNAQGTTTVDDLLVADETITVNNGGDQAAADTNDAGLIVSMSDATNATIHYDSTATSKWKAGEVGSTVEIADISSSQTFTNKTLTSPSINGSNLNFGTASNSNRVLLPNDTSANLDLLTDVAGLLAYDTTSNLLSFNNGGGWTNLSAPTVDSLVSKTTTYTATTNDIIILCDSSGGAFTITLYAASGNAGRKLKFIKTTSDTNAVTIDGNGSETINGSTTTTINTQYEELEIVCDGSNWFIINRKSNTAYTSYTPTGSWVANSTYAGKWRRIGDSMQIEANVTLTGAPTSANLTINIPSGYTIDTSKMSSATSFRNQFGSALISDAARVYTGNCAYSNTVSIVINHSESGNYGTVNQSNPVTFASGDGVFFNAIMPISGWKADNE